MFTGLIVGAITKVIGSLGTSFLKPILAHYQNKDTQFARMMVAALQNEADMAHARVGMLKTTVGALLIFLIVGGPAMYTFSIFGVTLLESFTGIKIVVLELPARWEAWGIDVIKVFIGGGSLVTAANVAATKWNRK